MLIDVLAQHRPCRNVTLRKSYNRAVVETGSGTYAPICLNVQPKPSPGRMAAPNSLRPGLSFRRHLRHIELGIHEQGHFKRRADQLDELFMFSFFFVMDACCFTCLGSQRIAAIADL
jgi:hypothetical protein